MALAGQSYTRASDPNNLIGAACAPAETFLNEALNRTAQLVERAGMISDRLSRIEARVFGSPLPAGNAQGTTAKAVPSGAAGALRDRLDELSGILRDASEVIDRLDNIA